jgi:hypothetical protein
MGKAECDAVYRRPRAWAEAKRSLGKSHLIRELMEGLERIAGNGCPRVMLAVSIHHFLSLPHEEQRDALLAYCRWAQATQTQSERDRIDAEFQAVMARIFSPDPPAAA